MRLDADDRVRLGDRVIVSRDGRSVFLYADTEERAREVERMVLARLGHPAAGNVELVALASGRAELGGLVRPASRRPRPSGRSSTIASRSARRPSRAASGHGEWEVRVELDSHAETVELADRLEAEGIPVVRRYTFLLVGAENEDQAHELAARLEREAPKGARIEVEPGGQMVWEVAPAEPLRGLRRLRCLTPSRRPARLSEHRPATKGGSHEH